MTPPAPAGLPQDHPCYDEQAHFRVARLHLPVAPRCNVLCAYCDRRVADCVHTSRPGLAARLVPPGEAPDLVARAFAADPRLRVVGVAGPGEPLANPETFEALARVRSAFPSLRLCVATNGLELPTEAARLAELGVTAVTVTVNTVRPEVGAAIYLGVSPRARALTGREAPAPRPLAGPAGARLLIERQLEGIRRVSELGLAVKVNTVLVPGLNDGCVLEVARAAAEAGAVLHNVMPLLPLGAFSGRRPPTCPELRRARAAGEGFLRQFRLCRQCRADAVGVPGEEAGAGVRGEEAGAGIPDEEDAASVPGVRGRGGAGI